MNRLGLLLPAACALLVVWAASFGRPAPRRVRVLLRRSDGAVPPKPRSLQVRARLGGLVLTAVRRPSTALTATRVGGALLASACAIVVSPLAVAPAALVAWALPGVGEGRRQARLRRSIAADLPATVDLLSLAVGAGLTVRLAVEAVARRARGPLAGELGRAAHEARLGRRLADALDDVVDRAGEEVRPLISILVASERYGAQVGAALERLSLDTRMSRRRQAEEDARKVPVKLLFPLVSCTLPAFALLTVAPLIAGALRSLRL